MSRQNNTELNVSQSLDESLNPIQVNNEQDAADAAAALLSSEYTPKNIKSLIRYQAGKPLSALSADGLFKIESKLDVARVVSALLQSECAPGSLCRALETALQEMALLNQSHTVLQTAAFIQIWDESSEVVPAAWWANQ